MGIRLPKEMNKDDQAEYEKLKALSGSDFETAYLTLMLKGHHQAMRNFRVEANSATDEQLKDVVTKGEHVIHEHLVMVNKLAREKGIPMPDPRWQASAAACLVEARASDEDRMARMQHSREPARRVILSATPAGNSA